jgi:hypothetical protein
LSKKRAPSFSQLSLGNRASRCRSNAFSGAAIELFEEMNAFGACFAEKLGALYPDCTKTRAMIHPGHLRRHAKQDLKLGAPKLSFEGKQPPLKIAQPIGVEIDVPGLVAQNAIASLLKDGIARTPVQQTIVSCPNQLCDHQHLQLEVQTQSTAREPKKGMGPMSLNRAAAKVMDQLLEQTGVRLFFGNKKFERLMVSGIVRRLLPGLGE